VVRIFRSIPADVLCCSSLRVNSLIRNHAQRIVLLKKILIVQTSEGLLIYLLKHSLIFYNSDNIFCFVKHQHVWTPGRINVCDDVSNEKELLCLLVSGI